MPHPITTLGRVVRAGVALAPVTLLSLLLPPPASAAPGALDATFGSAGVAGARFPGLDAELLGIALQRDGRIVLAGRVATSAAMARGRGDVVLVRVLATGRLDRTFGRGGRVRTRLTGADRVVRVLAQPDGRLVVVAISGYVPHYRFGRGPIRVVRYDRDGQLDRAYGRNGVSEAVGRAVVYDAVQRGGGVVLLASLYGRRPPRTPGGVSLVRLARDGRLDRAFGRGGFVRTPLRIRTSNALPALGDGPRGDVVVAGAGRRGSFVGRYSASGRLTRIFEQPRPYGICPLSVAAAHDGSVLVAGRSGCGKRRGPRGIHVLRFRADGRRDRGFGTRGAATWLLKGDNDAAEQNVRLVARPSGRIVLAGIPVRVIRVRLHDRSTYVSSADAEVLVARLTPRGLPDPSFAPDGETRLDASPGGALSTSLAGLEVQLDGRILVAASAQPPLAIFRANRPALSVFRLAGGARRAARARIRLTQLDHRGRPRDCGRTAIDFCGLRAGGTLRLEGRIVASRRALRGAPVSVRIYGALDRRAYARDTLTAFVERVVRVERTGTFRLDVRTRRSWFPTLLRVQAHVAATRRTYDVRSPLHHVFLRRLRR